MHLRAEGRDGKTIPKKNIPHSLDEAKPRYVVREYSECLRTEVVVRIQISCVCKAEIALRELQAEIAGHFTASSLSTVPAALRE